jgi:glutamyl-tRNA reductase
MDHSEAIMTGVERWLDANKELVKTAIEVAIYAKAEVAVHKMSVSVASAIMGKVAEFFEQNRNEIIGAIAAATAANWVARGIKDHGVSS